MGERHAWFAASRAKQWLACGASAVIDTSDLVAPPKPKAERGSMLHSRGEEALDSESDDVLEGLDPDDRASVQDYVNYVRGHEGWTKFFEFWSQLTDQCGGTSDCVMVSPDGRHLKVVDYKSGAWYVDPAENSQLVIYGAGVLKEIESIYDEIEDVSLVIVQPACGNYGEWETTALDLRYRGEQIKARVREIMDGDAEFNPGDETCKFCPGREICPAHAEYGMMAARLDFENREWDEGEEDDWMEINELLRKDPSYLTLSEKMRIVPLAKAWCKTIEDSVRTNVLADPDSVPGWKAVEGRRLRSWTGEEERAKAEKYLRRQGFKKGDLYSPPSFVSPSAAERLFKGAGATERRAGLRPFIHTSRGDPTVVPESDPRPPLDRAAMARRDFADTDEDDE